MSQTLQEAIEYICNVCSKNYGEPDEKQDIAKVTSELDTHPTAANLTTLCSSMWLGKVYLQKIIVDRIRKNGVVFTHEEWRKVISAALYSRYQGDLASFQFIMELPELKLEQNDYDLLLPEVFRDASFVKYAFQVVPEKHSKEFIRAALALQDSIFTKLVIGKTKLLKYLLNESPIQRPLNKRLDVGKYVDALLPHAGEYRYRDEVPETIRYLLIQSNHKNSFNPTAQQLQLLNSYDNLRVIIEKEGPSANPSLYAQVKAASTVEIDEQRPVEEYIAGKYHHYDGDTTNFDYYLASSGQCKYDYSCGGFNGSCSETSTGTWKVTSLDRHIHVATVECTFTETHSDSEVGFNSSDSTTSKAVTTSTITVHYGKRPAELYRSYGQPLKKEQAFS